MPTLQRFHDARVLMYIGDHPPPHVHVRLRDGRECTVDLDSLQVTGRVAKYEIREVLVWISVQRRHLFAEWQKNNP